LITYLNIHSKQKFHLIYQLSQNVMFLIEMVVLSKILMGKEGSKSTSNWWRKTFFNKVL